MIKCSDSLGKESLLKKNNKWSAEGYEKIVLSKKGLGGECRA